ncbi:MAG: DUF1493 family protein [Chitinophagaceae bacterium]|nr:DUF1493 family protein [Chitinophagaceae bacterium]
MTSLSDIIDFVRKKTGEDSIRHDTDIFDGLGCCGDDFHELMDDYFEKFNVNSDNYLWYFHSDEEGQNIGGFFFRPPNERVKRIPVTPALLFEFINKGFWDVKYPEYKLPKYRIDIWINYLLIAVVLFWVIKSCNN